MLEGLDWKRELAQWRGYYFSAITGITEKGEREVAFMAFENGISFRFPGEHWKTIRNLFRRAWQSPEVIRTWEALELEYGEL